MHRIPIGIRGLFERALRSGALTPDERGRLQAELASSTLGEGVEAILHWLPLLSERGVLLPLPTEWTPSGIRLRYAFPDSIDRLVFPLPSRAPVPGLLLFRARLVTLLAPPSPRTLEALRGLAGKLIGEGGQIVSRAEILRAAETEGQRALEGAEAVYFPIDARRAAEAAYAPPPEVFSYLSPWSEVFDAAGDQLLLAPHADRLPGDETDASRHGLGSLLAVEVRSPEAGIHGYLEWRARDAEHFTPERMAQAAHFAAGLAEHLTRSARVESLIYVDRTTGAFNVNHFQHALGGELARAKRDGKSMALLLADIDDFKRFNTAFGYEAGNQVLAAVARVLQGGVRPFDSVARWGGEEFAVILSAPVGREEAESVAERLRHQVEGHRVTVTGLDGTSSAVQITVSMGVALFPDDAADSELLWRAANRALLVAKQPPKNRVVMAGDLQPKASEPKRRPRRGTSGTE